MFDVLIFSPFFPGLSSCSCFFLPGLPLFFCLRHHLESAPLLLDVAARLIQKSRHCFPKAGFLHAAASFFLACPCFSAFAIHLESAPLLLDVAARPIQKSHHCFSKASFLHADAVISVHGLAEKQKNRPELNVQDGI